MSVILENLDLVNNAIADIDTTRYFILSTAGVALVIGMFWMMIMKMCAGCITWTAIFVLLIGSFALTYYLYLEGVTRQEEIDLITDTSL